MDNQQAADPLMAVGGDVFGPRRPLGAGTGSKRARRQGRRIDALSRQTLPLRGLLLPEMPRPLTSFVGREDVAAAVTDLLCHPDVRLVTLTGPAGTGKTRLALHVARALGAAFAGVGFVPLAPIAEPDLVLPTIAHHLGLREDNRGALLRLIQTNLGGQRTLLILDNFEQAVTAAPVVSDILSGCPNLSLLVTSRIPLRVSGEREFPVPPLSSSEAVRLFCERAEAARPGFALTDANAAAIADICARLDGLPLAVELAAVQVKILPPQALLEAGTHPLPLLAGGPRDAPARQRTLRNAIAWSYDLLSTEEQRLFRRLGVFVGGFSLDAAAAVASRGVEQSSSREEATDHTSTPRLLDSSTSVFDGIARLVEQSLVQAGQGDDEPRFALLETIREFGRDRLALAGEAEAAGQAHARFFLDLAERVQPRLAGADQVHWLRRLDRDRDNLRAALGWFVDRGEAEAAQRLAAAAELYWEFRGQLTEAREGLERALALPGAVAPRVRANALLKLGLVHYLLIEYADGCRFAEQSLAIARSLGDRLGAGRALETLGRIEKDRRELPHARALLEESLALLRGLDEGIPQLLVALRSYADTYLLAGDTVRARALFEESLAAARAAGHPCDVAYASLSLGVVDLIERKPDDCRRRLEPVFTIFQEVGHYVGMAQVANLLGNLCTEAGDLEAALGTSSPKWDCIGSCRRR